MESPLSLEEDVPGDNLSHQSENSDIVHGSTYLNQSYKQNLNVARDDRRTDESEKVNSTPDDILDDKNCNSEGTVREKIEEIVIAIHSKIS